ncbi:REP-associated tyrosine transposase [Uliginosibacterium aquaticum]|uniref:Transposase n=1 Tax=Uliginosibacterium aquaticum TaxID=2731212 RepID=A0ABX2IE25_9RHOO|nr:transposase [Uliginosibacterium aquaticum]NSL54028.1 transposase [Uliginosibacterium aquaticum]
MPYTHLRKGRASEAGRVYLVTTVTESRRPVFADFQSARIVVRTLKTLHEQALVSSLAWVVMPDHLHWLFELSQGVELSEVIRRMKGRSAREINAIHGAGGKVWQRAFHDHAARTDENLQSMARYIVANPLRANLASEIGAYPHWDAVWL